MSKAWPKVRLGEVLTRSAETTELEPDVEYREITVRLWGKGVVERGRVLGAEIAGGRRFTAQSGQFIASRIDARNGAMGIVPDALDGAVVTNDFPLFNLNAGRILPSYIGWLCRTNSFVELCQRASEGTTNRVRLQEARFLALVIALPPLSEQQRIVMRIEELAAQIQEARNLRLESVLEADALLVTAISNVINMASTKELTIYDLIGGSVLRNGKSVKSCVDSSDVHCLTLSAMRNGRINVQHSKPVPLSIRDAKSLFIQQRDVFIVRGNGSKDLCGRAGLVVGTPNNVIFPDLFIQVPLPRDRMLPEFFVAVWNSAKSRAVIEDKAKTTSGIWKVNQGHILSITVPCPSLIEQRRIVAELDALQADVDNLKRLQAETTAELDALLPAILGRAFKGELA